MASLPREAAPDFPFQEMAKLTPEQITRLSLDIGREVTELVQRRLTEMAKWGSPSAENDRIRAYVAAAPAEYRADPHAPVREDEQPVGTFMTEAEIFDDGHPRYNDADGGVAEDARRVVRGQAPLWPKPPAEDDGA